MFVQVIEGTVTDRQAARKALDRWVAELAPGAIGWLGSTSGVAADGTMITLARFTSAEDARRNSDRPEQGAWWAETSKLFTGEPTFADSTQVDVDLPGDPDEAGFVQVIQSQVSDPDRARQLMRSDNDLWRSFRPDVIGSLTVVHDDDRVTVAVYFTSETAAREAESKPLPPALQSEADELARLWISEPRFIDLKEPWLHSPQQLA